jgi:hypothetical protein
MPIKTKRLVLVVAISLLSALLAYAVLTSPALAQTFPDKNVCPLSDEQTQKSIQAFDKIANVFTAEPRCVNCHGAVNPFGADANKTHGGGKLNPITKTEPNADTGKPEQDDAATLQQCAACHDAFSGHWQMPRADFFFVGKDAPTLCKFEKAVFSAARDFIGHIEHDEDPNNPFVQEAFTGRMGLNRLGRSLANKYPAPPGVTHQDLIQMAHDWVDAHGGRFRGGYECGCKKHHYSIGIKETGVSDRDLADGGRARGDISGQGEVPLTFKDDGSFSGEVTLPESFTESLTRPIQVCSGKGSFSNQMKVTGKVTGDEDGDGGGTMHLKFSWASSGTVSGTCTSKGVTNAFNKSLPWTSADVKSPLADGFDMDAAVGETHDFPSTGGQFTFTHTITIKQID